jgi:hypothetical protein
MQLEPVLPPWALWAGCPAPREGEDFRSYVTRLGLDADELLEDLNEVTLPIANQRLASLLMRQNPDAFLDYLEMRRAVYVTRE